MNATHNSPAPKRPEAAKNLHEDGVIFWFRNDLRLHDQAALQHAVDCAHARGGWLLLVHVQDPAFSAMTPWGFERKGTHRQRWEAMALADLQTQLQAQGQMLLTLQGPAVARLCEWAKKLGTRQLVCEDIPAPEEQAVVGQLRAAGLQVQTVWQSTLLDPRQLPMAPQRVPDTFTAFRQALEATDQRAAAPLAPVRHWPPQPAQALTWPQAPAARPPLPEPKHTGACAFPYANDPLLDGGETAALAHLARCCAGPLPHRYKHTRNGLLDIGDSTKWSPWLATGALSARQAWAAIADFERRHGATDSTYWIWFELLWRDHFRWLHLKHGARLYAARGLHEQAETRHDPAAFERWCQGRTGQPFIDAGMRELAHTGYLSNRMRQNVASYLIHDLACDWRAGAAWFESQLIDYDVCSNQGNWLYLSGRGTDPRGHRRFNPDIQAQTYDADGLYRQRWSST
jgi:deoxyribodipyrimidine photo-lyase